MSQAVNMETRPFTWYQDGSILVGWLDEYPDDKTQGDSLEELQENLRNILGELESGTIPHVLHRGELKVA